jgi:tetratricopeptide (TPR) repeat protein
MVFVAAMATTMAERLASEYYEPRALADLQARAWAELGNARRVANDSNRAEADISRALARAEAGTGDPRLLARLMDLTASLYTAQRRFDDALQLLEMAHYLYEREGEEHAMGRALIKKGIATGHALDSEQAVQLLAQGLALVDARQDPKLILAAVHNLIWFCVDCGRLDEASRLLSESRDLYSAHAEHLDVLKARWMDGRIAAGFGDDEEAEQAFLEVRAGFEAAELSYDAALVSLDLAAVWLRSGRTSDIRSLIDEMLAIFRARNIRREAIGALLMLREAFEMDRATVGLLRNVASELQRLDREPARRTRAEP